VQLFRQGFNLQNWPTLQQWVAALGKVIVASGLATIPDSDLVVIPFGATLAAPPSLILIVFYMPSGTTVMSGDVVQGTITTTQFQVQMQSNPGDAIHQIGFVAFQ
jgi:hypothetical protein